MKERKKDRWNLFGNDRWKLYPIGGEFANDVRYMKNLYSEQPYEITFAELSSKQHTSFILGSPYFCESKCDKKQKDWITKPFPVEMVKQNALLLGYKFKIEKFEATFSKSTVTVRNIGVAPIYYDAYITVNGKQASKSLKELLPGISCVYEIDAGGSDPKLTIESKRLVPGQKIGFVANL